MGWKPLLSSELEPETPTPPDIYDPFKAMGPGEVRGALLKPPTGPQPGFGEALLEGGRRGLVQGFNDTANVVDPFKDRPEEAPKADNVDALLGQGFKEGWSDPKWWASNMAYGLGKSSPSLALAAGLGLGGEAVAGPPGAFGGAAAGFGLGSAIQTVAPAYAAARAEGLDHDAAVDRALKQTGIAAAFGTAMGLAPGVALFGRTVEGALKKPVSEALAQIFGVQPSLAITQGAAQNLAAGKDLPSTDDILKQYAIQSAAGGALVGGHAALRKLGEPGLSSQDDVNAFLRRAAGDQAAPEGTPRLEVGEAPMGPISGAGPAEGPRSGPPPYEPGPRPGFPGERLDESTNTSRQPVNMPGADLRAERATLAQEVAKQLNASPKLAAQLPDVLHHFAEDSGSAPVVNAAAQKLAATGKTSRVASELIKALQQAPDEVRDTFAAPSSAAMVRAAPRPMETPRTEPSVRPAASATRPMTPELQLAERGTIDTGDIMAALNGLTMPQLDPLGYTSKALEVAKTLPDARGTGDQMRGALLNKGVKEAELQATGLDKYLHDHPNVTRDEVVQFLEANRVQLQESKYQVPPDRDAIAQRLFGQNRAGLPPESRNEVDDEYDRVLRSPERKQPKWRDYSIDPSNPTYEESVLHLGPNLQKAALEGARRAAAARGDVDEATRLWHEINQNSSEFISGHWSEPNIIAHARTQELQTADGRRVLNLDELQSDWGQKIREGGARDEAKIADLERRIEQMRAGSPSRQDAIRAASDLDNLGFDSAIQAIQAVKDHPTDWRDRWDVNRSEDAQASDVIERYVAYMQQSRLLYAELATAKAATPAHPLVRSTDQWLTTALKRLLTKAAERDVDGITITPGDVQNERYSLAHVIDGFYVDTQMDEGRRQIHFKKTDPAAILRQSTVGSVVVDPDGTIMNASSRMAAAKGKQLSEVVGAEIAQKLMAAPDGDISLGEMKVGGKGMRETYDSMYPKTMLKILQKFDKSIKPERVRVISSQFDPVESRPQPYETWAEGTNFAHDFTFIPLTEKAKLAILSEGQPMFAIGSQGAPNGRNQRPGDGTGRTESGSLAPLKGAPAVAGATGPDPRILAAAERYAREHGIDLRRQAVYAKVDEALATRIAGAYEELKHEPNNPQVREAYADMIDQTIAQYRALEQAGYKLYFYDESNDPYQGNPWNSIRDLRQNQTMGVFATEAGFGSGATAIDVSDSPMLQDSGIRWPYGAPDGPLKRVLVNDLFRAVHDMFGHSMEGAGFRAQGEENAWQAHIRLYTGLAQGAVTSETRGQNSWLNFGPYGEKNRNAAVEDTVFADQKIGLMPEWTWQEGRVADEQPKPTDAQIIEILTQGAQALQGWQQSLAAHYGTQDWPGAEAAASAIGAMVAGGGRAVPELRRIMQSYGFQDVPQVLLNEGVLAAQLLGVGRPPVDEFMAALKGFFNAPARAVERAKQDKATPQQWKKLLAGPGIPQEQVKWMGLDIWLDEQAALMQRREGSNAPKAAQTLSKDDVLRFINAHEIKLRTRLLRSEGGGVMLDEDGDPIDPDERQQEIDDIAQEIESDLRQEAQFAETEEWRKDHDPTSWSVVVDNDLPREERAVYNAAKLEHKQAMQEYEDFKRDQLALPGFEQAEASPPKIEDFLPRDFFEKYGDDALEGQFTYNLANPEGMDFDPREYFDSEDEARAAGEAKLQELRDGFKDLEEAEWQSLDENVYHELWGEAVRQATQQWNEQHGVTDEGGDEGDATQFKRYSIKGGTHYSELLVEMPALKDEDYRSEHFGSQEIVHVRYDLRRGPNNELVLFVHEIQSDLHQRARGKKVPKLDEQGRPMLDSKGEPIMVRKPLYRNRGDKELAERLRREFREKEVAFQNKIINQLDDGKPYVIHYPPTVDNPNGSTLTLDVVEQKGRYSSNNFFTTKAVRDGEVVPAFAPESRTFGDAAEWIASNVIDIHLSGADPQLYALRQQAEAAAERAERAERAKGAFPDAPYKGNAWWELGFKAALQQAITEGASAIALTTPDQIRDASGTPQDVADKFYGENLPRWIDKYLKQWGSERRDEPISGTPYNYTPAKQPYWPITDKMKADLTSLEGGQALAAGTSDNDVRMAILGRLRMGRGVSFPDAMVETVAGEAAKHRDTLPEGTPIGVLAGIAPVPGEPTKAQAIFRMEDGQEFRKTFDLLTLLNYRALFNKGGLTGKPAILLCRYGASGDISQSLRGEIRHEAVHATRHFDQFPAPVWQRLLDHAASLRVLNLGVADYLEMIGQPTNRVGLGTLGQTYEELYAPHPMRDQLLDEEQVAHLIELHSHGQLSPQQIEPVRDLIENFLNGEYSKDVEYDDTEFEAALSQAALDALPPLSPADRRILRQEAATLDEQGRVIAGRPSSEGTTLKDRRAGTAPPQPIGSVQPVEVAPDVTAYVQAKRGGRDVPGRLEYKVFRKGTPADRFDAARELAQVELNQHPDGSWEVQFVASYRKGLATQTYNAIEKDLGIKISPSGMLTPDGHAYWSKRSPDSVKWHRLITQIENGRETEFYYSPRQIKASIADLKEKVRDFSEIDAANGWETRRLKEAKASLIKYQAAYASLPKEARQAVDTMFALSGRDQVKTPQFQRWFRDSKVVEADGEPLPVYHATLNDFETFSRRMANPESDMGAGFYFTDTPEDAANNYAHEGGPDIRNRIDRVADRLLGEDDFLATVDEANEGLTPHDEGWVNERDRAEEIAKAQLGMVHEGLTIPVYLSMQNPVVVGEENRFGGPKETVFDYDSGEVYDPETDDFSYGEPTGKLAEFFEAFRGVADRYDMRDDVVDAIIRGLVMKVEDTGSGLTAKDLIQYLKASDRLMGQEDDEGRPASSEIIRRTFERMGFDGIIDRTVDAKWGFGRFGAGMKGVNPETTHYIVFKPTQIKSVIGNRGSFDPDNPDITAAVTSFPRQGKRGRMEVIERQLSDLSSQIDEAIVAQQVDRVDELRQQTSTLRDELDVLRQDLYAAQEKSGYLTARNVAGQKARVARYNRQDLEKEIAEFEEDVQADPSSLETRRSLKAAQDRLPEVLAEEEDAKAELDRLNEALANVPIAALGGAKALTADLSKKQEAIALDKLGTDPEEIWRSTGWIKGLSDDEWYFEIDDSDMALKTQGGIPPLAEPGLQGQFEHIAASVIHQLRGKPFDQSKFLAAAEPHLAGLHYLSDDDIAKIRAQLEKYRPGVEIHTRRGDDGEMEKRYAFMGTLGEMLDAPTLFANYPQLKGLPARFSGRVSGAGSISPDGMKINSRLPEHEILPTIAHELQHMIQIIEGWDSGGNLGSYGASLQVAKYEAQHLLRAAGPGSNMAPELEGILKTIEDRLIHLGEDKSSGLGSGHGQIESYRRIRGEVQARLAQFRQGLSAEQRRRYFPREDKPRDEQYAPGRYTDLQPRHDALIDRLVKDGMASWPDLSSVDNQGKRWPLSISLTPSYRGDNNPRRPETALGNITLSLDFTPYGIAKAVKDYGVDALLHSVSDHIDYRTTGPLIKDPKTGKMTALEPNYQAHGPSMQGLLALARLLTQMRQDHPELRGRQGYRAVPIDKEGLLEPYTGPAATYAEFQAMKGEISDLLHELGQDGTISHYNANVWATDFDSHEVHQLDTIQKYDPEDYAKIYAAAPDLIDRFRAADANLRYQVNRKTAGIEGFNPLESVLAKVEGMEPYERGLRRAQQLERANAQAETIWRQTGWRRVDGAWQFSANPTALRNLGLVAAE